MHKIEAHSSFLMNLTILVVDDDSAQLDMLKAYVENHGGICFVADNLLTSIDLTETYQFDVAICDICLDNENSGFDFIDKVHKIDPELTVILTTGFGVDQFLKTIIKKNIYAFLSKPFEHVSLGLLLLQASRNTKNLRKNSHLADTLRSKVSAIQKERDKIFFNTLTSLSNALEQKDEYTKNHSEDVAKISERIAFELSDDPTFIEDIAIAGRLHDIGKIGVSDEILFKKDSLSEQEYEMIKKHSDMSYKIIKPVDDTGKISEYVLHHHERWDGNGYPHKLKEKGIPIGARILTVADTFNALVSNRPYRQAKTEEFAIKVLFDGKSTQFDPDIVDIFYMLYKTKKLEL